MTTNERVYHMIFKLHFMTVEVEPFIFYRKYDVVMDGVMTLRANNQSVR